VYCPFQNQEFKQGSADHGPGSGADKILDLMDWNN